jgi:hypothetical protein
LLEMSRSGQTFFCPWLCLVTVAFGFGQSLFSGRLLVAYRTVGRAMGSYSFGTARGAIDRAASSDLSGVAGGAVNLFCFAAVMGLLLDTRRQQFRCLWSTWIAVDGALLGVISLQMRVVGRRHAVMLARRLSPMVVDLYARNGCGRYWSDRGHLLALGCGLCGVCGWRAWGLRGMYRNRPQGCGSEAPRGNYTHRGRSPGWIARRRRSSRRCTGRRPIFQPSHDRWTWKTAGREQ